MSVNIDNVYQQVLTIVNKNQVGGYVDSDEFNRYAKLAQLEWFNEGYLDYGSTQNAEDNFAPIKKTATLVVNSDGQVTTPTDYYHFSSSGSFFYISSVDSKETDIDVLSDSERRWNNFSSAFRPNKEFPAAVMKNGYIQMYPKDVGSVITLEYLAIPFVPFWNYTVTSNRKNYAATGGSDTNPNSLISGSGIAAGDSTDFVIPAQHEQDIIQIIVKSIGTEIRDPALIAYQPETGKPVQ